MIGDCRTKRGRVIDHSMVEGLKRPVHRIGPCEKPGCVWYQMKRNALVKTAEENLAARGIDSKARGYGKIFLFEMDRLWEEG